MEGSDITVISCSSKASSGPITPESTYQKQLMNRAHGCGLLWPGRGVRKLRCCLLSQYLWL